MQGNVINYNLHCKVAFGANVQTKNLTTNDMCAYTTNAIAIGLRSTYQGGMESYSPELIKTLHWSWNDFTIALTPADAIMCVAHLAKDSLTAGLQFTDQLCNLYNDNPENNNEPITSWFLDAPQDAPLEHESKNVPVNAHLEQLTETSDSLNNTGNYDPDNITIRITGVNDQGQVDGSVKDDNFINTHDEFVDTVEYIERAGVGQEADSQIGVPSNHDDIKSPGVDHIPPLQPEPEIDLNKPNDTGDQCNYVNLQGIFGDISPTIEVISQIQSKNEQRNFRKTLDFIADEARRDQMINNYILTQYILGRAGLEYFGEDGREATTKELQQMLIREVFSETDQ